MSRTAGWHKATILAMKDAPPHLQALEEVERAGIPGLLEVLREEGLDGVRYGLWKLSGWHRDYSPPAWRNRATEDHRDGSRRGPQAAGRGGHGHPPRGAGGPVQAPTLRTQG